MAGTAGNVLVVTTTCHLLGSPGLLGMETPTRGGGLGAQHRAGARACSVPELPNWCLLGAPAPHTNLDSRLKRGPVRGAGWP